MKKTNSSKIMTKFMTFVMIAGLSLVMGTGALAATTNSVGSKPPVLIGGTAGPAGVITIAETGAGALSGTAPTNTFMVKLPTGVTFNADVTVTPTPAGAAGLIAVNHADPSGTGTLTVTVTSASTIASSVVISGITLDLAASVDPGDVVATITSGPPANPGLTAGTLAIASAIEGEAVAILDPAGTVNNVAIGGAAVAVPTVQIYEATAGSLAATDTIELQLPVGVNFSGTPTAAGTSGGAVVFASANATLSDTNSDGLNDKAVWTVQNASTVQDRVDLSNISVTAGSSVAVGDIVANVASGTAFDTDLTVAVAANSGIEVTAVETTQNGFTNDPTEIDELPTTPAGRVNVTAGGLMIVENFANDLTTGDILTVTLPEGVFFASAPTITESGIANLTGPNYPDPTGFNTINLSLTDAAGAQGGIYIGDAAGTNIVVSVGSDVPVGNVAATIEGTVGGEDIAPISVDILEVVETTVEIEANDTIPTVGVGSTGVMGTFTISETAPQALLSNGSTIKVTLPAGATWAGAGPTATETTATSLALGTKTFTTGSDTVTFRVSAASTAAPATISIAGSITLEAGFPLGSVMATVSGTAGAAGTVEIATAADGVTATATSTPSLVVGTPTQAISAIVLTESFAGALGDGAFRLLTNAGTWAAAAPTITVSPTGAKSTTNVAAASRFDGSDDSTATAWDYAISTTFNTSDTLIVYAPSNASSQAATLTFSGLKLNVPEGTPEGRVNITLVDGDMAGDNSTGVKGTTLLAGFIGTPADFVVTPTVVPALQVDGEAAEVAVTGGIGDYTAVSADEAVATVAVDGGTVTITPVAVGTTTVTISDGAEPANEVELAITVEEAPSGEPLPTEPVTENPTSAEDIAAAKLNLGSIASGGNQMEFTINVPAYNAPVDVYFALGIGADVWVLNSDGEFVMDLVPYVENTTEAASATIFPAFNVCPTVPFANPALPDGEYAGYWLVFPAGTDVATVDWENDPYEFGFYTFEIDCVEDVVEE